jgi:hypothetical protein
MSEYTIESKEDKTQLKQPHSGPVRCNKVSLYCPSFFTNSVSVRKTLYYTEHLGAISHVRIKCHFITGVLFPYKLNKMVKTYFLPGFIVEILSRSQVNSDDGTWDSCGRDGSNA